MSDHTSVIVNKHWALIWTLIAMLMLVLEGMGLGTATPGETLSAVIRGDVRFDPVGRFVILPLWAWLTWHWILASERFGTTPTWRDLVAALVGVLWAASEQWHLIDRLWVCVLQLMHVMHLVLHHPATTPIK